MKEFNRGKNTFTSYHGLHLFLRMRFGLKNAPATFHWEMDVIFCFVKCQSAFVYLDNIVDFSHTVEQHLNHLPRVLMILRDTCVTLKPKDC